jgi:hypothetical protein
LKFTDFEIGELVETADGIGRLEQIYFRHGHPVYLVKDREYDEVKKYNWGHVSPAGSTH